MNKFLAGYIVGMILCTVIFLSGDDREIKSEKRIKPKIELIIKDNKVDTLYVYNKDK